jgi:hypothetical protein
MALRIHKEKVAALNSKKVVPYIQTATVPPIQDAGSNANQIQEVIPNVRQISPTRFDKLMAESIDVINKNRILLDNYYVDVRWRVNGVSSFENVIDAPSMKSIEENKIVINEPFSTEILSNSHLQNRVSDAHKRTLDEKEIRLRKILTDDISKPAPLKRKRQIEMNPRLIPFGSLSSKDCAIIPEKKKRTEPSYIIVF